MQNQSEAIKGFKKLGKTIEHIAIAFLVLTSILLYLAKVYDSLFCAFLSGVFAIRALAYISKVYSHHYMLKMIESGEAEIRRVDREDVDE